MATERPNIVLISVDQWRGDCLSIDGHPVVQTPYLDSLALTGARFGRAYAAVPSCIAARTSLMTGLSPRRHGRVGYQDGVDWDYPITLAGEFGKHGYQTQCVGKMHVHPARTLAGFHNIVLHDGYLHATRDRRTDMALSDDYLPWLKLRTRVDVDYTDHGMDCNSYTVRPWDKEESLHPTNFVVSEATEFLRRRDPRKPFLLYMSFHRPHPPLDPPAWAFEMYRDAQMPEPPIGDWVHLMSKIQTPMKADLSAGRLTPEKLRRARAGYYGHITHLDHQIERFMLNLHEFRLKSNTWVVFVSDHGDLMGDHDLFRKSFGYEGSARVPLLVVGPQAAGVKRGLRVEDGVVELMDVLPSLLDMAGLPAPDGIDGKSFLPLACGKSADEIGWRPYLHGEHAVGRLDGKPWLESAMYLTDGREKYLWFSGSGTEQLFDLRNDPAELVDLAASPGAAARVAFWRQRLIHELKGREEGFTDGRQLIPDRPVNSILSFLNRK